jgi:hypothetical protein
MYSERRLDGIERDPGQFFKRYNAKNPERGGAQKASGGKARGEMKDELLATRQRWAEVQNEHLARHGHDTRVDHRSLNDQGIDRAPEKHLGGAGVRALAELDIATLLERRAAEGEQERAQHNVSSLIDVSGDLAAAKADRTVQQEAARKATALEHAKQQAKSQLVSGAADFRARFMADRATKQEMERKAELARQEVERIAQEHRRQAIREQGRQPKADAKKEQDGPSFTR